VTGNAGNAAFAIVAQHLHLVRQVNTPEVGNTAAGSDGQPLFVSFKASTPDLGT